jgi:light-regulated signal transduction histidine kinase (bacteriophytochrome)
MSAPDGAERVTQDMARRNERLVAAMREFETLSLALSHDFRLPLGAIERIARAIGEGRHTQDSVTAQGLRAIHDSVAAMQAMIANLLELCRLAGQPMELEWIDMEALAREAWAGIENTQRVEVSVGKLPATRGHRGMLKLVWTHLLSNAVRHSAPQEQPRVEITGGASGEFVVYAVRDNGKELNLGYAGKLFYVFEEVQKQSEHPGTGVGLAIVQRIVTRHRGNLWVEARPDKGAFFQFSLPLGDVGPGTP